VKGHIREVLVIRLMRGENIYAGIVEACEQNNVRNAAIISVVGSLNGVSFYEPIVDPGHVSGISYGEAIRLEGPVEVLSVQGEICHTKDGDIKIHLHATFADREGKAYGGHLMEENIEVLNVINVFLGIIEGVDMGFEYEAVLGGDSFHPKGIPFDTLQA